ncbi:MAG: CDP-diacylglycerol--glycerol-3-phosphate 3-phosphatidyltransferase [Clostridia bacterium]|nr:CDP-diacylglycerol--glycerol-3-phosphate 3-phosphatidyltransferase [Clostridia bacterium]
MKLNIPNKLTLFRIAAVPVFLVVMVAIDFKSDTLSRIICASLYLLVCLTDTLDGYIARKYHMITNFGKFLDPLADKFIVFAALLGILVKYPELNKVFIWAAAIVMFRELAVTSMRLIVAGRSNLVIAASWLGKIKTVSQMACILIIMLEPVIFPFFAESHVLSYVMMGIMTMMTLWSGIDYFVKYGKYVTSED